MKARLTAGWLPALLLAMLPAHAVEPPGLLAGFPSGSVVLESSHARCLRITAWFADRPEHQAQGLMHVRRLEPFEGMLFRYPQPTGVTMWMKNTLVPLDMLFIAADGRVTRIEADTVPLSERRIRSGSAVTAVLELPAGFSERWGLEPGDRLLLAERETHRMPSGR